MGDVAIRLEPHEKTRLRSFVDASSAEELVEYLARTEVRLRELDERLRAVKRLIDDAHL